MPAAAPGEPTRLRRWPRRVVVALNVVVAFAVLSTSAVYGYVQWRLGQIEEIDFGEDVLVDKEDDGPMNVLLVGSDTRAGLKGADRSRFGVGLSAGNRSDAIMILHVDPGASKAALLSIPRDLWVTIADTGRRNRINTAFDRGPQNLIETIRQNLGIDVHHYVQVDFVGFRSLVDAVGGVEIPLRAPARDSVSGLDLPRAGCVELGGEQALAWVRSRHFQEKIRGSWRGDPSGDHGRIERQHTFMRQLMAAARDRAFSNPLALNKLIGIAVDNLARDSEMSNGDVARLARRFRSLEPGAVEMLTLPTTGFTTAGGASVLRLRQPDAQAMIDRLNGVVRPTTTIAPGRAGTTGSPTTGTGTATGREVTSTTRRTTTTASTTTISTTTTTTTTVQPTTTTARLGAILAYADSPVRAPTAQRASTTTTTTTTVPVAC